MKCKIQKYDPAVTEAPFQMIDAEAIEMEEPDKLENTYLYAEAECNKRGYDFKFFTSGDDECDLIIVIYGEFEENQLKAVSQSLMDNFGETYSKLQG